MKTMVFRSLFLFAAVAAVPAIAQPLFINLGCPTQVTDSAHNTWSMDLGNSYTEVEIDRTEDKCGSLTIGNTQDEDLFCIWKQFKHDRTSSINFPISSNGNYDVTFYWADLSKDPGQRLFDVFVEGHRQFKSLDVSAESGGKYNALNRTVTVPVTDGVLNVIFNPIKEKPILNAISIKLAATQPPKMPAAPANPYGFPMRINVGSPTNFTDTNSQTWVADNEIYYMNSVSTEDKCGEDILGTDDDGLYCMARYYDDTLSSFMEIPVPYSGDYTVTFFFSDLAKGNEGDRFFDIDINGQRRLNSFDAVLASGGRYHSVSRSATVFSDNGKLSIMMTPRKDKPMLNGIMIELQPGTNILIDFEGYSSGDVLSNMPDIGNGIRLSAFKDTAGNTVGQAMIFDTSNPTGGDIDLGTPNEYYGGPGVGVAGGPGPTPNTLGLGNVIIVSEDQDATDPDDNVGGLLIFDFPEPMILHNIGLLDNEEGTVFEAYTESGQKYTEIKGQGGDNSAEVVSFASDGLPGVIKLTIAMNGSGAISFVEIQKASEATLDAPTPSPNNDEVACSGCSHIHRSTGSTVLDMMRASKPDRPVLTKATLSDGAFCGELCVAVACTHSSGYLEYLKDDEHFVKINGMKMADGKHSNFTKDEDSDGKFMGWNVCFTVPSDVRAPYDIKIHTLAYEIDQEEVQTSATADHTIDLCLDCAGTMTGDCETAVLSSAPTAAPVVTSATAAPVVTSDEECYPLQAEETCSNDKDICDELNGHTYWHMHTWDRGQCLTKCVAEADLDFLRSTGYQCGSCPLPEPNCYDIDSEPEPEQSCGTSHICADMNGHSYYTLHRGGGSECETKCVAQSDLDFLRSSGYRCGACPIICYDVDTEPVPSCDVACDEINGHTYFTLHFGEGSDCQTKCVAQSDLEFLRSSGYNCGACPTNDVVAPTAAPTKGPTKAPTDAPTKGPTKAPTAAPTKGPTKAPTVAPTEGPTKSPTDAPTKGPTNAPTKAPTDAPTKGPTKAPTKAPIDAPTKGPTNAPTKAPTVAPTKGPTKAPTDAPTKGPTNAPIDVPVSIVQYTDPPVPDQTDAPVPDPTSPPVSTRSGVRDPPEPENNCMEDNWFKNRNGGHLVCAAKEVTLVDMHAPRQTCKEGEMFPMDLNATIKFNTARYDAGWYIATDGGDALTGTCAIKHLEHKHDAAPMVLFDAPRSDAEVGQILWNSDFRKPNDDCGDVMIHSGGAGFLPQMDIAKGLNVMCTDKNDDGNMDFGICFSWRQPGGDDKCKPMELYPGTPSKCFCMRYDVPQITVEKPDDNILECL